MSLPNREFYGCPKPRDFKCHYFKWCEELSDPRDPAHTREIPPGGHTLALPSLSTGNFGFDVAKAAAVAISEVSRFLKENHAISTIRILLADEDDVVVEQMESARDSSALCNDDRFEVLRGCIADLSSLRQPVCFVANTANSKLSTKGGVLNRKLFLAAQPHLQQATEATWPPSARVGVAYAVALPATCALRGQGAEWVLHARGPNMNPNRPDCLEGDYDTGCKELAKTYRAVLEAFGERL